MRPGLRARDTSTSRGVRVAAGAAWGSLSSSNVGDSQTTLHMRPGSPAGRSSHVTAYSSPPSKQAASPRREPAGAHGCERAANAEQAPRPRAALRRGGGYPSPEPNAPRQEINSFAEGRSSTRRICRRLCEPFAAGCGAAGGPLGSHLEDTEQPHRFLEDIRPDKVFQLGQGFLQVIYCTYPKAGSKPLEEAEKTH